MKNGIFDVLKGTFLTNEDAPKNWGMIAYLSVLALVMISSAHRADQKVVTISELNEEVKELHSQYVDTKTRLTKKQLESSIKPLMAQKGIYPSENPPVKIKVNYQPASNAQ